MPEIGFDEVPMRPVMRDETVTKKKPKTTIRIAARKLPCVGMPRRDGEEEREQQRSDEHDDQSACRARCGAGRRAAAPAPKSFMLSRNDETIVGIVRPSVMSPAASTAPAPV